MRGSEKSLQLCKLIDEVDVVNDCLEANLESVVFYPASERFIRVCGGVREVNMLRVRPVE